MEIRLDKPKRPWDWLSMHVLYLAAFPASERKPFAIIRRMYRQGRVDVWRILQRGKFAGFAAVIKGSDIVLLDYLAVRKSCRGSGIGSAAMSALLEIYPDKGFFVEIESTREETPDRDARVRRKRFYQSAGLEDLEVSALVFGVKMELMGIRCQMTFEDFQSFYREYNSPWAAAHLEEL